MRILRRGFFLVTGLLSCPCHLPLTLPLLLMLTAGTAAGAFMVSHVELIAVAMTIYFVVALTLVLRSLSASESACPTSTHPYRVSQLAETAKVESVQME